jgi:hypothetical protein
MALAACAAGCAAGSQTVKTARTARYRGDGLVLFAAAKAAVEANYQLKSSDETSLRIETTDRWYTPDGLGASERNSDLRDVPDRSVNLRLVVKLVPEGELWGVSIDAPMLRYVAGRPNPDRLALEDPGVPGWAIGKVDQLYAAIHGALQSYAVGSPGGTTPSRNALPTEGTPPAEATQLVPRS